MHITKCDCCGKECDWNKFSKFSYLCHLETTELSSAYVDNDGNPISGRMVEKDLCNKCYNSIVGVAVEKFRVLKQGTSPVGETKQKRREKC